VNIVASELFNKDTGFLRRMNWRKATGIVFLSLQVLLVVAARFTDERAFCWAPHDMQTEYELTCVVNGRELEEHEISRRFRIRKKGRDPRGVGNVKQVLVQHCRTYGKDDDVSIIMEHTINGIRQEPWRWQCSPAAG